MEAAITLPAGPSAGLFADLGGAIFRRCLRILRDEAAAARCAESLFVRFVVYADAPGLEDRARWNWIYRVATSHSLRQLSDDAHPGGPSAATGAASSLPALPDMRTLRRMDEALQIMLVLTTLDGLSAEETADALGVPLKVVRRRLASALPGAAGVGAGAGNSAAEGGVGVGVSVVTASAPDIGAHPSMLALDRDRAGQATHLAGCARCRALVDETDQLAGHFARALAPAAVGRVAAAVRTERARRAAGPNWKRIAWLGGGFALVTALAMLVARPRPQDRGDVPYAGLKGASRGKASGIHIAVGRGTEIRPLAPTTALRPGDRLFFRVKAERPRYLELRIHDARGERRIFPSPSGSPQAVSVRPDQTLDVEYLVESNVPSAGGPTPKPGQTARAWIIGLFADQPFACDQPPGPDVEIVPVPIDIELPPPAP